LGYNVVFLKRNEFRFSERCGNICNGCEDCNVLVVRVFENYHKSVPFFVINR